MSTSSTSASSSVLITPADFQNHFRAGEKPREKWRIGTEHEKIGFFADSHQPLPYPGKGGIGELLQGFHTRYGWQGVREHDKIIALMRGEASITLEPGGQLELSGAAFASTHETCQELSTHLDEIRTLSDAAGLTWLMMGRNPVVPTANMPWMPKDRYAMMRDYLPRKGSMALDMMLGTGTVQTNIDYDSEADMGRKMRIALGLSPVITALFANSPFAEGKPTGYLSTRSLIWENTDNDRAGFIPGAFEAGFGYKEYAEYALDVPMFFIYRNGEYLNCGGTTYRAFQQKGLEGHRPTQEDWELHLTTLFPQMRLKQYLELRMADVGPGDMICAFSALTRGIFYDQTSLAQADDLMQVVNADNCVEVQHQAAKVGLKAQAGKLSLLEMARQLMQIAEGGLNRLNVKNSAGENEVQYLAPLQEIAATGKTRAERLLDSWEGEWNRSLEPLFTSPLTTFYQ